MKATNLWMPTVLLALAGPGPLAAADSSTSLSILPTTGIQTDITAEKKELSVQYTQLLTNRLRASGRLAVPFDASAPETSLLEDVRPAPGLDAELHLWFDNTADRLNEFYNTVTRLDQRICAEKDWLVDARQPLLESNPDDEDPRGLIAQRHAEFKRWAEKMLDRRSQGYLKALTAYESEREQLCKANSLPAAACGHAGAWRWIQEHPDAARAAEYRGARDTFLQARRELVEGVEAEHLKPIPLICGTEEALAWARAHAEDRLAAAYLKAWQRYEDPAAEERQERQARREQYLVVPQGDGTGSRLSGFYYAVGLDFNLEGAVKKVYVDDIAQKPETLLDSSIQAGGSFTHYATRRLAWKVSAGAGMAQPVKTFALKRCQVAGSTDPDIRGEVCEEGLLLKATPEWRSDHYVRVGAIALGNTQIRGLAGEKDRDLTPAVEAQVGIEHLGGDATLDGTFQFSLMSQLTDKDTGRLRVGLGVHLSYALEDSEDGSVARGDIDAQPYITLSAVFGTIFTKK